MINLRVERHSGGRMKLQKDLKTIEMVAKNPKRSKFVYYSSWISKVANNNRLENEGREAKRFNRYKRGTIVFVDFGVGMGQEFSKQHMCIVLNKDDHPKKGTITVVPLSSKNFGSGLKLGDEIYKILSRKYMSYLKLLTHTLKYIGASNRMLAHDVSPEKLAAGAIEFRNNMEQLAADGFSNQDILELMDIVLDRKESEEIKLDFKSLMNIIKKESERIVFEFDTLTKKYNKKSFAVVDKVTTISKVKVMKPKNKYDPMGNVVVSNLVLDLIDIEMVRLYTGIDTIQK